MRVFHALDLDAITELRAREEFFWLDLKGPQDTELAALGEHFDLHPVALEDSHEFGQRPKLDTYGDHVLLVFYGTDGVVPVEVHVYVSGEAIITIRHGHCTLLAEARQRLSKIDARSEEEAVYRVLDALTDSFLPVLERIENDVDRLEEAILADTRPAQRDEVLKLRRELAELRRVARPQRDLLNSAPAFIETLPGLAGDDAHAWVRDVQDHLMQINERIEAEREALTQALDLHLAGISNRLGEVSKQLTLVATIFLPLTFVTGFFGQNFGWLVDHIDTSLAFVVYGVGGMLLFVVALYAWFRRSGFFEL